MWPVHAWFTCTLKDRNAFTMGMILVTAGKISVAMGTTEELFRTDEEHR